MSKDRSETINNSKLLYYLRGFSKKDTVKLQDFCCSPFFNKNEKLSKLLKIIIKFYPKFDIQNLKKETIHQKAIKSENFDDAKFNNRISKLIQLTEEFICQDTFKKTSGLSEFLKIQGLKNKKLSNGIINISKNFSSKIGSKSSFSPMEMLLDYLVEEEKDNSYLLNNELPYQHSIELKSQKIDIFYLLSKLRIYSEQLNRERVLNVSFDKRLTTDIISFFESRKSCFKEYPIVWFYYDLIKVLSNEKNATYFDQFYKRIKSEASNISPNEAALLFQHAANYSIRKINGGHDEYLGKLLEIFKLQDKFDLLVQRGQIHDRTLKNVIEIANKLQEYDWAENFLWRNIDFIKTENKEMISDYNLANILFSKGAYKEALRKLTFVNIKDPFYQIASRMLVVKIFFHENDIISIESAVSNFKSYLGREKQISNVQKKMYFNFLTIIISLYKLKTKWFLEYMDKPKLALEKQLEDLKVDKTIADRNWLMGEIIKILKKV